MRIEEQLKEQSRKMYALDVAKRGIGGAFNRLDEKIESYNESIADLEKSYARKKRPEAPRGAVEGSGEAFHGRAGWVWWQSTELAFSTPTCGKVSTPSCTHSPNLDAPFQSPFLGRLI